MIVYVAAPYAARGLVARRVRDLVTLGFEIGCTWQDSPHLSDADVTGEALATFAAWDLTELGRADLLVSLAASDCGLTPTEAASGGRHVEFGVAVARDMRILHVGGPENAFHRLPQVRHAPDWPRALSWLAAERLQHAREQVTRPC